jgi:tetratricopeptide (TPR) repeat protein
MATPEMRMASAPERLFPQISSLYSPNVPGDESTLAQRFVVLANKQNGWRSYAHARLRRDRLDCILSLHRAAFCHERQGQFRRADCFWHELLSELPRVLGATRAWEELSRRLLVAGPMDAATLRNRFVDEILAGTHVSFYNAHLKAGPTDANSRCWVHLDYLMQVLELMSPQTFDRASLVEPAIAARVNVLLAANRTKEAMVINGRLLSLDPECLSAQERLANLAYQYLIGSCLDESSAQAKFKNIDFLELGTQYLDRIQKAYPDNRALYEKQCEIQQLKARQLAEVGRMSAALVAAATAVSFNPSSTIAAGTMLELSARMEQLQEQARQYRAGQRPGHLSSNERILLFDETRIGFTTANEYSNSAQAKNRIAGFTNAKARTLWRRIGLSEAGEQWTAQALALTLAVDSILGAQEVSSQHLVSMWRRRVAANPDLTTLDHDAIVAFLKKEIAPKPEPTPSAGIQIADENDAIEIAPAAVKQLNEPFSYWFISARNPRLKFLALAAMIILIVACTFSATDARARYIRSQSYQDMRQAEENHDYSRVMDAAESFLSHPIMLVSDDRDEEVVKRYQEAIVRWSARQPDLLRPEVVSRIERYRELVRKTS